MRRIEYFLRKLFHISNCFNCKFWIEVIPTWENPGGNECCYKNKGEWIDRKGCILKEMER